jgi:aldose 1-epimerase
MEVSIVPSLGNNSYQMKVKGHDVFWSPYPTLAELRAKPAHAGNPFLAPWANRIEGLAWQVTNVSATDSGAEVTSRLELWRHPDWMAQFPFAHNIEMTYRLKDGALEVDTMVENLSRDTMPLSVGYHPYFRLTDSPRDEWKIDLPARELVVLSSALVPTGEIKPHTPAEGMSLRGQQLDGVFSGLVPGKDGKPEFSVQGKKQKISVIYGPKYPVAVVWAPPGREFICFEPMTGPTNAFNLAHAGKYKDLQTIPPGGRWRESFWVVPSGY